MRGVCRIFAILLVLALGTAASQGREEKSGWVNLLEGSDLSKHWTTKGNWKFARTAWSRWSRARRKGLAALRRLSVGQEGVQGLRGRVRVQGRRRAATAASTSTSATCKDPVAKGIEVQIYDSGSKTEDAKLSDHDSGGIIPGIPPTKNAAKPAGEWNRFDITCKATR